MPGKRIYSQTIQVVLNLHEYLTKEKEKGELLIATSAVLEMSSRSKKILYMAQMNYGISSSNHPLFYPKYESTKGLDNFEKEAACSNWKKIDTVNNMKKNNTNNTVFVENPNLHISASEEEPYEDSADEYVPSPSLDSSSSDNVSENENNLSRITKNKIKLTNRKNIASTQTTTENMVSNRINTIEINKSTQINNTEKNNTINTDSFEKPDLHISASEEEPYEDSEDEYVPSTNFDSSSSDSPSDNVPENEKKLSRIDKNKKKLTIQKNNASTQTTIKDLCTDKSVPNSTRKSYSKKFFCIFCLKTVTRFARHLTTFHKDEPRVCDILRYPSKNKIRKNLITQLRNEGSLRYNNDKNKNTLIVTRRPNIKKHRTMKDYTPCPKCSGYYVAKNLFKHYKKCFMNQDIKSQCTQIKKQSRGLQLQLNLSEMDLHPSIHNLLKKLKDDAISEIIKTDYLLLHIASYFCYKYNSEQHLNYHARQKLRQLARLYNEIKSDSPEIIDFEDCFKPNNFRAVITGVQRLCCLDINSGQYRKPAMANHLGIYLKEACDILHSLCIIEDNKNKKQLVTDFKNLLNFKYGAVIARGARKNVEESKWNRPITLPTTSDIEIFKNHLTSKAETAYNILKESFSFSAWKTLVEITATLVLTFNRKRPGEVERMLVASYHARQKITEDSEEYKTMSTLEKLLCQSFERVEIRGKLGRRVTVLLRENHILYINMFLQYRSEAGVSDENTYLFGYSRSHIRLNNIINNESALSGAKHHELLRATLLRKQVATTSQLLDLNDNEMQLLADFMGHDIQIHKTHYRTPELTQQIATLSKFLVAVDNGEFTEYKGKNFKNLDIAKYLCTGREEDCETDQIDEIYADTLSKEKPREETSYSNDDSPQNNVLSGINLNKTKTSDDWAVNSMNNNIPGTPQVTPTKVTPTKVTPTKVTPTKVTPTKKSRIIRRTWRTPEKYAVRQLFKGHLESCTLPSEKEIVGLMKNEPRLKRRTPKQVKAWINNDIRRRKLHF